jgi:phosphatidylserine/phosphatidylglycerophosphate/cardiolipin synthase-like enzyme
MHNKFLIFCDAGKETHGEGEDEIEYESIVPRRVWTGSYNLTTTAARSWENAIIIDDPSVAEAFAHEYAQTFAFSEPLDWDRPWVVPEYRIGT